MKLTDVEAHVAKREVEIWRHIEILREQNPLALSGIVAAAPLEIPSSLTGTALLLDFCSGGSLSAEVDLRSDDPSGKFTPQQFQIIAHRLLTTLHHLHRAGILHREICCSKLLIDRLADGNDVVKLSGIGQSKFFDEKQQRLSLSLALNVFDPEAKEEAFSSASGKHSMSPDFNLLRCQTFTWLDCYSTTA